MAQKYIESFAQYGGVIALAFEWTAVLSFYALLPADFSGQHPISYFATLPQTRLVFSVCFTLAVVSFWISVKYHLGKYYRTPARLFALSMLGFAAVALAPFDPSNSASSVAHSAFALLFSATFFAGMLATRPHSNDALFRNISVALVALSAALLMAFLCVQHNGSLVLITEVASGVVCQAWVVYITFPQQEPASQIAQYTPSKPVTARCNRTACQRCHPEANGHPGVR